MGIDYTALFIVGYIYLSEFCEEKMRPAITTVALVIHAECTTLCSFYFNFIAKEWWYFQLLAIFASLLSFISVFFMPESPRYLLSIGEYKRVF